MMTYFMVVSFRQWNRFILIANGQAHFRQLPKKFLEESCRFAGGATDQNELEMLFVILLRPTVRLYHCE
ncbi:hypothetical protein CTB96_10035 [Cryobacterium arcticum]|uniref:Uncharacterized protein n=1 Tax=Cryobacterium arcticum TaxID=670052 RepID=A0A317ZKQ3_9MICO|nr:hypothetical protein CTB96_10035 [Cryobacterium arcticum]